jgi:hypothetical protein
LHHDRSNLSICDGSGAEATEATGNLMVGNNTTPDNPPDCKIHAAMVFNRALSLGEVEAQRTKPHVLSDGSCKLFTIYGQAGTGSQLDLSGNGNNGTVTGAAQIDGPTQILSPWNVARRLLLK